MSNKEQGKTYRMDMMEKLEKSGTAGDCLAELEQELEPLCRHVFNAVAMSTAPVSQSKSSQGLGPGYLRFCR